MMLSLWTNQRVSWEFVANFLVNVSVRPAQWTCFVSGMGWDGMDVRCASFLLSLSLSLSTTHSTHTHTRSTQYCSLSFSRSPRFSLPHSLTRLRLTLHTHNMHTHTRGTHCLKFHQTTPDLQCRVEPSSQRALRLRHAHSLV